MRARGAPDRARAARAGAGERGWERTLAEPRGSRNRRGWSLPSGAWGASAAWGSGGGAGEGPPRVGGGASCAGGRYQRAACQRGSVSRAVWLNRARLAVPQVTKWTKSVERKEASLKNGIKIRIEIELNRTLCLAVGLRMGRWYTVQCCRKYPSDTAKHAQNPVRFPQISVGISYLRAVELQDHHVLLTNMTN